MNQEPTPLEDKFLEELRNYGTWEHHDPPISDVQLQSLVIELLKRRKQPHCATCQCSKVFQETHVVGNPRSRSWHKGVPQKD